MPKKQSVLVGRRYGRWVVQSVAPRRDTNMRVVAKCNCGTVKEVAYSNLHMGRSTGCAECADYGRPDGHRMTGTPQYTRWVSLKQRGEVCKEWRNFETFLEWLCDNPPRGRTLQRKDESKPFGPDNIYYGQRATVLRKKATVIRYLVSRGESSSRANTRVESVTRERLRQLFNKATAAGFQMEALA